jgi:hypothetical protein
MTIGTRGAESRPYRDRYAGLVCFGVLEILLGLMAVLGLLSIVMVSAMGATAASPGLSGRTLLPAAAMYLSAAVFFCWMGVGSLLARRWARALMLIASWFWLVTGVSGSIAFIWMYPAIRERMVRAAAVGAAGAPATANPADAARMVTFIQGCTFIGLGLVYLLLPLALVLFYRSRHVKATCEARDPHRRWTDRCPLPVLGLSLLEGVAAIAFLGTATAYHVLPVFGVILGGLPALALALVLATLLALAARGTYRVAPWAWWAAAAFWLLGAASGIVTLLHPFDWKELYRQMGLSTEQFEQLGLGAFWQGSQLLWLSSLGLLPGLLYLAWVRRFFFGPLPPGERPPPTA